MAKVVSMEKVVYVGTIEKYVSLVKTQIHNRRSSSSDLFNYFHTKNQKIPTSLEWAKIILGTENYLKNNGIDFENKASVCKYLVPKGYPENPEAGAEVSINKGKIEELGARLYYASVDSQNGKIFATKSRSFGIVGFGKTIEEAEKISQSAIETVKSDKLFYRKDIGTKKLLQRRIEHMRKILG